MAADSVILYKEKVGCERRKRVKRKLKWGYATLILLSLVLMAVLGSVEMTWMPSMM